MSPFDAPNYAEFVNRAVSAQKQWPVLGFPENADAYDGFKTWSARELGTLAERAATHYAAHGLRARRAGEPPLLVTIFAPGTLEWAVTFFALVRMGHAVFAMSARLSDEVVAALLQKAGSDIIIYERPVETDIKMIPIVSMAGLSDEVVPIDELICDTGIIDPDVDICHICHSSGSTGIPKLFPLTHRESMDRFKMSTYLSEPKIDWIASATYNVVGLRAVMVSLAKECPTFFNNDRLPFTSEGLVKVISEIRPDEAFVTPYSLGLVAARPEGIEALKRCNKVTNYGAVCPSALGNRMVKEGVTFSTEYGMSEVSRLLGSRNRPPGDDEWDWMVPTPAIEKHMDFRPLNPGVSGASSLVGDQLYELVLLPSYKSIPARHRNCDDPPGSFATGDLFLKHPTKASRWKLVGRKDDQVKIYQGNLQSIVNANEYEEEIRRGNEDVVDEVVLFGQGRGKLGVLIFAQNADGRAKDVLVERVWASINHEINGKMNTGIEKDMILVVAGDSALPRTTKLNFIRPQVYLKYKDRIDAAYAGSVD